MNYDKVVQFGTSVNRVGVANMQSLTLMPNEDAPAYHEAPGMEYTESQGLPAPGSPHLWLAALLVLVAALWLVNQHYQFGPLNLLFVLLVTIAGIALLKTFFGRFHVPGLSQVVMSV